MKKAAPRAAHGESPDLMRSAETGVSTAAPASGRRVTTAGKGGHLAFDPFRVAVGARDLSRLHLGQGGQFLELAAAIGAFELVHGHVGHPKSFFSPSSSRSPIEHWLAAQVGTPSRGSTQWTSTK